MLKQDSSIGFVVFFWVLSLFFASGYFYFRWKKPLKVPVRVPVVEDRVVVPVQTVAEWIQLPHGLLLCKKAGILKYKEQQIVLSGNMLKLFRLFISKEHYSLTSEEVCIGVLGREMNTKTATDRNTIAQSVSRLRECINSFVFVKIQTVRGKGYLLIIEPEAIVPK